MQGWLSIGIMIALGAGFGLFAVALSSLLGPRKPSLEKSAPYECGMPPVGGAHERQSIKFYLVAMIFLLFDIEVAFLYPWAMALRDLAGAASSRSCCSWRCSLPAMSTSGARARSTGAARYAPARLTTISGRSGSSSRSFPPGTTPRRKRPARSPSSWPSSSPGSAQPAPRNGRSSRRSSATISLTRPPEP